LGTLPGKQSLDASDRGILAAGIKDGEIRLHASPQTDHQPPSFSASPGPGHPQAFSAFSCREVRQDFTLADGQAREATMWPIFRRIVAIPQCGT
jgi:hypothetical protein